MRRVVYSERVALAIERYIFDYKQYFRTLYSDTGIFSEELLLSKYEEEAKKRHREIMGILQDRLQSDQVFGRNQDDTMIVSWRSKTLWFSWEDREDVRIITDLAIR